MIKKVQAGKDRVVIFPQSVLRAPGAKSLSISGDTVVEVDDKHRFVRRSLRNGDIVEVKATKTAAAPRTASKEG